MSFDYDIGIIGGGLNGPALGLALAQAGLRVAVVDAQPARARAEAAFDGRAYALAIASKRLLSAIGIWPAIAPDCQPMLKIRTSDGRAGEGPSRQTLTFDSAEIEEGPAGFMVEDRHLYAAFLAAMQAAPGLTHIAATRVTGHQAGPQGASLSLSDGTTCTTRLLVACDGRASPSAFRAGIRRSGHAYGQTALVCAVSHTRPHQGIAHQFFMPTGPLAILPLKGNRSSIVWSETEANARTIAALDDAAFLKVLRPRFGDFLGEIALAGPRFSYPLTLTLANDYIAPRLALVGDAAHGVHPIAGQGLNLGLRDVAALAEVLVTAHRRGEDIGAADVLERYHSWRRFDSTRLALGMDGVNWIFSNDNPALRTARDLGLDLVNRIAPLRRAFMREAAGLTGQTAKLLTGQPL
ncbi:MAG: FAD-dependent monooxygenase [Rhodobacteraceae bacterium]|nr:FAD-dependent monooxygenase [Paracoccaceae bacterium]